MSDPARFEQRKRRRQRLARTVKLPMLSGRVSALALCACFLLSAILIPMALGFERWIEYEIVLATWWFIWVSALTMVLYHRRRISHDFKWREPRKWFGSKDIGDWLNGLDLGPVDLAIDDTIGAACAIIMIIIIAIPLLIGLAWLVVEVAIPAIAFLMYLLVRGMLAQVANDWHGCHGSWLKSSFWGVVWASVYTAPLALLVWGVHLFHR